MALSACGLQRRRVHVVDGRRYARELEALEERAAHSTRAHHPDAFHVALPSPVCRQPLRAPLTRPAGRAYHTLSRRGDCPRLPFRRRDTPIPRLGANTYLESRQRHLL